MMGDLGAGLAPEASAEPRTRLLESIRKLQDAVTSVDDCRTPVVAAVSGWCIGAGLDLIAAADIRVAAADARFSVREIKVAIVADLGSNPSRRETVAAPGEGWPRRVVDLMTATVL